MKKRYLIPVLISTVMALIYVIAMISRPFADFYVQKIFPHISNVFSMLTDFFPFSLGEIMIVLAILLVIVGIPLTVLLLIFRKKTRRKTAGIAALTALWVLTYIITTETLNCFVMYRTTPMSEQFYISEGHTRDELIQLYSALIDAANKTAPLVPRDSDDRFYLTADVTLEARAAMGKAAELFPQLDGYYPEAKPIQFSYFMSQSHLSGIYFPFSLEANYNDDIVRTNLPDTVCHEYAHLKGFIQEDEASFIAYVATTLSDNVEFRYAGYIEGLEYVHNQIYDNNITEAYYLTDRISDQVRRDWFRFLPDTYWEDNKKKEIISTEKVSTASTKAMDTNIKLNGREEGVESYSLMVDLMLDYYFSERK
jgi:hypothetical protein